MVCHEWEGAKRDSTTCSSIAANFSASSSVDSSGVISTSCALGGLQVQGQQDAPTLGSDGRLGFQAEANDSWEGAVKGGLL